LFNIKSISNYTNYKFKMKKLIISNKKLLNILLYLYNYNLVYIYIYIPKQLLGYYKQKPKLHIVHIPLEEHCMQSLTHAKI